MRSQIRSPSYVAMSGDSCSTVFEVMERYLIQDKKREGRSSILKLIMLTDFIFRT